MRLSLIMRLCLFGVPFLSGCGHERENAGRKETAPANDRPAAFVPPPDSAISRQQMTAWFACNRALDSQSEFFSKSLLPGNAVPTDSARTSFSRAQDRLCAEQGLKGGYSEYRWILEHLGSSKNKAVYDSVRMRIQGK
jgi:hypothetical protein